MLLFFVLFLFLCIRFSPIFHGCVFVLFLLLYYVWVLWFHFSLFVFLWKMTVVRLSVRILVFISSFSRFVCFTIRLFAVRIFRCVRITCCISDALLFISTVWSQFLHFRCFFVNWKMIRPCSCVLRFRCTFW